MKRFHEMNKQIGEIHMSDQQINHLHESYNVTWCFPGDTMSKVNTLGLSYNVVTLLLTHFHQTQL